MTQIESSTSKYERWLRKQLDVIEEDLAFKHKAMAEDSFQFLRATFYRWIEIWPQACKALNRAPWVLAVGDLHIENFGTWRDLEGRLVWGVNDFDEAYPLPYTVDLVRLATSAVVAAANQHLELAPVDACRAILDGYRETLDSRGSNWVLAEHHGWLRAMALSESRDPVRFWRKLTEWPDVATVPDEARRAIERILPPGAKELRIVHRRAGLGSLGRPRFTMISTCDGALIARETKPLISSACVWARIPGGKGRVYYPDIVGSSLRPEDPYLKPRRRWIARRLSPDCSRIELNQLGSRKDELKLLRAMGSETANIHLGTRGARKAILADLERNKAHGWLVDAADKMARHVSNDFDDWRRATTATKTVGAKAAAK